MVVAPGRLIVAFLMRGTHTGPLPTPLGTVAPTGREVAIRTIDVLTVVDGRIAAVCDVFDALTHQRPYKEAWTVERACEEVARLRGTHFDPVVADALLAVVHRRHGVSARPVEAT